MERVICFVIALALVVGVLSLNSCTKSTAPSKINQPAKKWFRVAAIGNDTVYSPVRNARGETTGIIIAEDNKLKAELMSYTPLPGGMAKYIIRMTNKTECQRILRWGWGDGISPQSIEPDDITAGTPKADVMTANQVKYYIVIAQARTGWISVKAEKSNSECENSSTLKLYITLDILPVKFIAFEVKRDKDRDYDLFINYTIETPEDANTFEIQESEDGKNYHTIHSVVSDKKTKVYSIRILNSTH